MDCNCKQWFEDLDIATAARHAGNCHCRGTCSLCRFRPRATYGHLCDCIHAQKCKDCNVLPVCHLAPCPLWLNLRRGLLKGESDDYDGYVLAIGCGKCPKLGDGVQTVAGDPTTDEDMPELEDPTTDEDISESERLDCLI